MPLFHLPGRVPECVTLHSRRVCRADGPDALLEPRMPDQRVIAVDGGSVLLGRLGGAWLGLVRLARVSYTIRDGTLVLDRVDVETLPVHVLPGEDAEGLFFTLRTGDQAFRVRPPRVVADADTALGMLRSMLEKEWAVLASSDGLVLLDGMLEPRYAEEEEVIRKAKEVGVVGVVKDPLIPSREGDVTSILQDWWDGVWMLRAEHFFIARLHGKARFLVRVDTPSVDVLSRLVWLSRDAALPGYPYPLVMADTHARISNREAELARGRILAETGRSDVLQHAHALLDSMRF